MSSFKKFLSSFNFENTKGIQFEYFVKWFLKNDPEWSTQVDEIWLWDEYPERWGPDCGIDLVFKHKNGETWAVQAKCYDTKYSITKKDVDTFLSESNRQGIDKRLLIASTDRVGKNAKQVCQAQEKSVVLYLYTDFDKAAIDYPSDISQLNSAKRKELPTPRPHQTKAIKDVVKGFKDSDRGQMIMACGTGKTFTTLWLKEALEVQTTLVLIPSLSLLSQTLKEWSSASNKPFEALCVCSDETVGKQSNADSLISSIQDVAFPTTSDPQEIGRFLDKSVNKVVFSTYHSSPSIAEAQRINSKQVFDLVIADEAHRCTGEAGKAFTTVLDNKLIKAKKRLFTTATPKTYSTNIKKKASEMGVDIADMSNEILFGKVFHNLSFGQAINDKLLTDYRVVVIAVDEPMISRWIEKRELVKTDNGEITDAKTLASQIGLIKAMKDYDLKRMISFHSRVKGAELFANDLHKAMDFVSNEHRPNGEIYTDFVSGKMSSYNRGLKLSQLKELSHADRGLLTNARCLSEGVDVPSLDGVAFIDPRSSQVDIVQAVGRAIRKSDNKTIGTIVLPVFIENTENAEESLQSSNFKPIYGVLNALKSHDETLSLELDQLRTNLGRQGGGSVGNLPDKIVFDLPKTIDKYFSNALKTIVIENTTSPWNFGYGVFLNYVDLNKNVIVNAKYKINNYALGIWTTTQRTLKKKEKLSTDRINNLNKIGFVWDVLQYKWDVGYTALLDYIRKNEDANIPKRYVNNDGYKLGSWVEIQRKEKNKLCVNRLDKLNYIDFIWDIKEFEWNQALVHCKSYKDKHKDLLVPQDFKTNNGFPLGSWISNQRQYKKKGALDKNRIKELDAIGFIWDTVQFQWGKSFTILEQYAKQYGHCNVPYGFTTDDGFKLSSWTNTQRDFYKNNKLSLEQVKKLNKLGFVWSVLEYKWNKGFEHLEEYVNLNGNTLISTRYITDDGYALGSWVAHQKSSKDIITKDQIQKLETIGFVWSAEK